MDVLVIDVGGSAMKFRLSTAAEVRRYRSGAGLTPEQLVVPAHIYRGGRHDAFDGGARLWDEHVEPHDAGPRRVWRVVR